MSAKFGQDDPVRAMLRVDAPSLIPAVPVANPLRSYLAQMRRRLDRQHATFSAKIHDTALLNPNATAITKLNLDSAVSPALISSKYFQEIEETVNNISTDIKSRLVTPAIDAPQLHYPLDQISNQLEGIKQQLLEYQTRISLADAYKLLNRSSRKDRIDILPPNWKEVEVKDYSILRTLLLDEGLALAWVPDGAILQRLIRARNQEARRRILDDEWESVAYNCQSVLENLSATRHKELVELAIATSKALLADHTSPAQAMAANLIDTLLCREHTYAGKGRKMSRKNRPPIGNLHAKKNMVYGGLWGSYKQYQIDHGDPIPLEFSRHASAHGVSHRQYTRLNALIALMHVTAYLCWLDCAENQR